MKALLAACAFILLVAGLAILPAAQSPVAEAAPAVGKADSSGAVFEWNGSLASGQTLEIKGVNGAIHAEPSTTGKVEVKAAKKSRRSPLSSVKIEVVEHADGVTICAVYPGRGNSCEPGDGGKLSSKNNDVKVHFSVAVPAGVRLAAKTVNGAVKAEGLDGPVHAETVNGSIDVETTSYARAETVNGKIRASMGSNTFPSDLDFETVNGSVTVIMPEGVNAEVKASSVNGKVKTDFPLEVPRTWHGGKASGILGSGGAMVKASAVNGSVEILRGE